MAMIEKAKDTIRNTALYRPLRLMKGYAMLGWELLFVSDAPEVPAPWLYKIFTIRSFVKRLGARIFIETGTNIGETLEGCRTAFETLYSVELDDVLYERARKRFEAYPQIHIFHGDSAAYLTRLVPTIEVPVVYWLDAHYSGNDTARGDKDTPIAEELTTCLNHWIPGSAILIDDARLFDGSHESYPAFAEVVALVRQHSQTMHCEMKRGIIRIY